MNPRSATVEASGSRRRPNRWDQFRSVEGEAHSSTGALVGPAADPRAEYRNPFVPLPSLSRRMGSNENDILIHRDHEEYRDGSPYMRLSAPICQPNIQMIWNANSTQDMTVNFELDIEPDIESCMEDFRQLVSFGRFKSAEECFEENLLDHVQEPIVTLGLAEMLLQQGAYGRLIDLCQDHSTRKSKGLPAWECETDLLSIVRERCISMIFWIGRFSCLGGYESSHHFMPEFKSHLKFLMSRLDPSVNDTSTAHLEEVRELLAFKILKLADINHDLGTPRFILLSSHWHSWMSSELP